MNDCVLPFWGGGVAMWLVEVCLVLVFSLKSPVLFFPLLDTDEKNGSN